ncbi:unnamed protein product [Caretta caretta]
MLHKPSFSAIFKFNRDASIRNDCNMELELEDCNTTLTKENSSATIKSSDFSAWEDYKSSVDDLQYFLIGLYTFISLTGFMGNLLILMALIKRKQNTIINILIGNLAFSDILVVLFCSPFTLTSVLLDQWMFGAIMCHVMPFLQCVSVLVSTLMLICIAVVRYRMIKNPLSGYPHPMTIAILRNLSVFSSAIAHN